MAKMMNTIRETYRRCVEEDIGISEHFIRTLAMSGELPVIKAGRTTLINFNVLMRYLETGSCEQQEDVDDIRPVPVKAW